MTKIMIEWCKIHSSTLFFSTMFIIGMIFILFLMVYLDEHCFVLFIITIFVWFLMIKSSYPREIEQYKESLKKKQYVQQIYKKIDKNYRMIIKGKEIFSENQKKEMLKKYKNLSQYYIDYEDDKKIIYIEKEP